jgi:hypothetical protein
MISRSIYNLKIDTISMYHTLIDSLFLQLSNGIRHVMPSTDRRLKLKAKDIDGSDRPAAGCVCEWIWLAGCLRDGCVCQWVNGFKSSRAKKFFSSQKRPDQLWTHPTSYSMHTKVLPLNDKKPSGTGYTGSRCHMGRFVIILHLLFS